MSASGDTFDSLVGATLANRYQIVRRIGEGGMGAVYEAKHTLIGKRVAVKVLLEKFLTKSDFVARLLQEARLASAIGHEHIVDVTDFGTTDDGRAFVVLEFLDGESLAELVMREAPLPVERSLRIGKQVASALGAAHAKSIVHRDVKPENVYLVHRGEADFVKVVDFGISKAFKQGQGAEDEPEQNRLTRTGLLLGTPLYMSPEQARGDEDLDHRVDIWALGVMLYECLTGEVPFRANNYLGVISQVLTHVATPPSKLRPELGIPDAVEAVVMRAMEKDRGRRYQTMAELERDLERLLAGDQNVGAAVSAELASAPPADLRPGPRRFWIWGAAAVALVGGVVLVLARPQPKNDGDGKPNPEPSSSSRLGASPPPSAAARAPEPVPPAPVPPAVPEAAPALPRAGSEGGAGFVAADAEPTGAKRRHRQRTTTAPATAPAPAPATAAARRNGADSRADKGADSRPAASPRSAEAVRRGALPSRSGEGYPDP